MISISDIKSRFPKAESINESLIRFEDAVPALKFCYYAEYDRHNDRDLLVVTNGAHDDNLALNLTGRSKSISLKNETLTKIPLSEPVANGLTHLLVAPAHFHNYLRGRFDDKRSSLFLLLAIFDCEFSGKEDEPLFRRIRQQWNAAIDPTRECQPRVLFRFGNPKTQGGTIGENFFPVDLPYLLVEIGNLNNVTDGFLEIQNYRDEIARITPSIPGCFFLEKNHKSVKQISSLSEIRSKIAAFVRA